MKVGKTTFASQFPNTLLLACEKGYSAIPGIYPLDITSWREIRDVIRELKKPEVKEKFHTIAIDTVDLAGMMCEKYVCAQNGVNGIAELPYGQGWNLMKREFEDVCRNITQSGYALIFISHDKDRTVKDDKGQEMIQIFPSCPSSFNDIAKNAADIYGYAQKYKDESGRPKVRLVLRSADGNIDTGSRFKYIRPSIEFTYAALAEAVNEAIDKEAAETNNKFITNERETFKQEEKLDYNALIQQFNEEVSLLMEKDKSYYAPYITAIVNKYLGKNKKVSDSTPEQVDLIKLIVDEINDELVSKMNS